MSRSLHQDLAGVAGVAECLLSEHLVAALPANLAEAPWTCSGSAVLWVAPGNPVARRALPPLIQGSAALSVVGGFIRYDDTPVGSYDEVLGSIGFRRSTAIRGHVAFMAVDSETSLVGGRLNWAMPKTLASFHGDLESKSTIGAESALKPWWSVEATPRVLGPAWPARARATVLQQRGDGAVIAAALRVRARLRPALVQARVNSEGPLPNWLRPGHHMGVLVERMMFTLAEAQAVDVRARRLSDVDFESHSSATALAKPVRSWVLRRNRVLRRTQSMLDDSAPPSEPGLPLRSDRRHPHHQRRGETPPGFL